MSLASENLPANPSREPSPTNTFNLEGYLARRELDPSFVVAEIGHRTDPIVFYLDNITGQRAYIGFEAWLRDKPPLGNDGDIGLGLEMLRIMTKGKNAFFLNQPLGGEVELTTGRYIHSIYTGDYNPETVLPDGAADELFIGNAFGDPHIANERRRVISLLLESARLIGPTGTLVIRETTSPRRAQAQLDEVSFRDNGLDVIGYYDQSMQDKWAALETAYMGDTETYVDSSSFYLILGAAPNQ